MIHTRKNEYFSLYFTLDLLSKTCKLNQKSRDPGVTAPLAPCFLRLWNRYYLLSPVYVWWCSMYSWVSWRDNYQDTCTWFSVWASRGHGNGPLASLAEQWHQKYIFSRVQSRVQSSPESRSSPGNSASHAWSSEKFFTHAHWITVLTTPLMHRIDCVNPYKYLYPLISRSLCSAVQRTKI